MTYEFFVPGPLPGFNEILKASAARGGRGSRGRPWGAYDKIKSEWTTKIAVLVRDMPRYNRAKLYMHWIELRKGRGRDPDNIAGGGQKLILDGMVAAGVLPDDGPKHVAGIIHSFGDTKDKDEAGVHVTVREDSDGE